MKRPHCPSCGSDRVVRASWPTTNRLECLDCATVLMLDGSLPSEEYQPLKTHMTPAELEAVINDMWGVK